ncbi:uncharacterized protein LOC120141281 [Hibiscus syriacus]|uniref:uncharacterized protein LOC120141281 n=1 Tax=Hibiscus syriacus TaxID=106335 RepID=UPI001921033C|nr:uncharacterized protein LOC120141281 [Hibiscus syriacus]
MIDQLYINVPFLEDIGQMPTYVKFLKHIVTKKRKVEKYETVTIAKDYCYVLSKLLPKRKDTGSFIIPYSIGYNYIRRTLYDIGSNVNLILKSIFLKLGMGNARPTTIIMQLADLSYV